MNKRVSPRLIVAALAGVVVAALVAVLVLGGGSSKKSDDSEGTSLAKDPIEVSQVTVSGSALPAYEESYATSPVSDPAVGLAAPSLSGVSADGSRVEAPVRGQATLVVFFAHWCPHCNNELPRLRAWFEKGPLPADLQVVGVSSAVDATRPNYPPSQWLTEDMRWPWEAMVDDKELSALASYGVTSFPALVLVGADGTVLGRLAGETAPGTVEAWVEALLAV